MRIFQRIILLSLALLPVLLFAQTETLPYSIDDISQPNTPNLSNIDFSKAVTRDIQYNPETGEYDIVTKIGDVIIDSTSMSENEYEEFSRKENIKEYWKQRIDYDLNQARAVQEPDLSIYLDTTDIPFLDVNPFGSFDVIAGFRSQNVENPTLPLRQRKTTGLDFDMNIQMGVNGAIADRLKFDATYNTETNFNFNRNQFKVGYEGKEDDILQSIEFGNVSLPLRSTLIQGNQSLLGVKTSFQFGRLTTTAILSQQESKQQGLTLEGGTKKENFEIKALDYEENKHYFLSQYFRDNYERNLTTLPAIATPYNITRLQVWVTNRNFQTNNIREFVAFTDLGESTKIYNPNIQPNPTPNNYADNNANTLYGSVKNQSAIRRPESAPQFLGSQGFQDGEDYEIITARMLSTNEYNFNKELGYISLTSTLAPDEVLAVAFEYTDLQGGVHRVGEFSENLGLSNDTNNNRDQLLVLKLLKPRAPRTDLPTWDLMMKNIYSLGAYQIDQQEFRLDIFYNDAGAGLKRYLPVGNNEPGVFERPILQVLGLDRFNASTVAIPDGVFDFLPRYTIDARTGSLIFPVLEPFGDYLEQRLTQQDNIDALVFDELYDLTKAQAELYPEYDRYTITGSYRSEMRDEIILGAFNIPRGSVTVRSGGRILTEGVDYTIDYNLGRLKLVNTALVNSGVPLDVRFENNLQLGFQSKRLAGTRFDYYVNNKLGLGATVMNLQERPFTNKVNLGDDPVSNTVLGADVTYQTDSYWLTRMVDKLPFLETKEQSSVNLRAEVAKFIPGHSRQIGREDAGQIYIDDFEGSSSSYDLKFPPESWIISSTPQRFPESELINDVRNNFNRAKISWYNIDPVLNSENARSGRPASIGPEERSDIYGRQILEKEVFPNIVNEQNVTIPLTTFDVSYYPSERGPYNFNVDGLNADGSLKAPQDKWGGIMRSVNVTDFQAANIEFVEFWLMDPFVNTTSRPNNSQNSGKLVLNLGNISEDVLRDGRMFFENGLPVPGQPGNLDETNLGKIPTVLNINNAFAASEEGLIAQDVGYDGLNNEEEQSFFSSYFDALNAAFGQGSTAYQQALLDPAADDFQHFLGADYDAQSTGIVDRYKNFSNPQGNSSGSINNSGANVYNATNTPDSEDINRDNTLERSEAYYEYEIDLSRNELQVGKNFIVSKVESELPLANGQTKTVDWYQFKVPINGYTSTVNNIQGFQSIRFIRMYLTQFNQPTTLRFARLNLLRNQWRRYEYELNDRNQPVDNDIDFTVFPVNIEENQRKQPFPYTLPPGIQREQIQGASSIFLRNEQSLALNVCDLPETDSRAIYKLLDLDLRLYQKMKLFVHAESLIDSPRPIKDGEFEVFIRVGSDFSQNYYEYRQPLNVSQPGSFDPFNIWPEENNVDINIQDWVALKKLRNATSGASPFDLFTNEEGNLSVLGTPDLGRASLIMIGVTNVLDDKLPKCGEFWFNELRVSGLKEDAAYAATASADIKLADFGNVTVTGNMHTGGYGNLEQRIDQRYRDDLVDFDISGDFNLDKFLPVNSTVRLPVYASYSKGNSLPQYNPYETDILLSDAEDEVKDLLREEVEIKTINLTNIRKERSPDNTKTPKVYDIENFNLSYSYTEKNSNTAIIADEVDKTHYGQLSYNYNPQAKPIRPFFNVIKDQKYLQWAKEININPIPSNLGFTTDMTNRYQETSLRDIQEPTKSLNPFYYKDWLWNRNYKLAWDLTNSLRVNFDARNQSRIDQPEGPIDTQFKRDSIWNNIQNYGRNVLYNHTADASYQLPFEYVPILDFIDADVNYTSSYNWLSAPQELDFQTGEVRLNQRGNAIRNDQGIQVNANFNFSDLYNKSGFLKEYNVGGGTRTRPNERPRARTRGGDDSQNNEPADSTSSGGGLGFILKPLMSLKRLSVNYTNQRGTFVPGFTPTPTNLGVDLDQTAPGFDFVFGYQPNRDWLDKAARNNWITADTTFSYQFLQEKTQQFSANAGLQPFRDLNIDVNLNYSKTDNYSELFRNTATFDNPNFEHLNPYESGAYDISFISFKTLFQERDEDGIPQVFRDFEENRVGISELLAQGNPESDGIFEDNPNYREGYGPYSPDVIIPAFVAAYTGKSINDVKLNPFKTTPLPNWSLNYSGLTHIPFFNKRFSSFRLNHTYTSNFSINQYNSNLNFEGPEDYFLPTAIDSLSNNYFAFYYIPQVTITERFAPLAGVDFALKNGLTMRLNYTKSRTLGMSLLDYQLSERNSTGFTIGAGYQTNNLKLPFRLFGPSRVLENDILFRLDYSYQDDISTNYKLDQDTALPTRGSKTISLFPTIDYTLNDRMNIQLYLDRRRSEPKTRSSYPVSNTRSGAKISYTFNR